MKTSQFICNVNFIYKTYTFLNPCISGRSYSGGRGWVSGPGSPLLILLQKKVIILKNCLTMHYLCHENLHLQVGTPIPAWTLLLACKDNCIKASFPVWATH